MPAKRRGLSALRGEGDVATSLLENDETYLAHRIKGGTLDSLVFVFPGSEISR